MAEGDIILPVTRGFTNTRRNSYLAAEIPTLSTFYVGLFHVLPLLDETGGTELSTVGGYARIAHSDWPTGTVNGARLKRNNGLIEFGPFAGAYLNIVGWGLFDAASAGNLIALGPFSRSLTGVPIEELANLQVGDTLRIPDKGMEIG